MTKVIPFLYLASKKNNICFYLFLYYICILNNKTMKNEFIPPEQSLALKELGFDEPCFNRFYTKPQSKMFGVDEKGRHYPIKNTSKKLYTMGEDFVLNDSNVILAPLYQQVFRWFREKYSLYSFVFKFDEGFGYETYKEGVTQTNDSFDTYEEAELACLIKLIGIANKIKNSSTNNAPTYYN